MEVKTNVEYHAMQHQIAAANEEVGQHEEKILVNMMEADEQQDTLTKADTALNAAQTKVQSERTTIERDASAQTAVAAECAETRVAILREMKDRNIVDTFDRIAKVRGTAVARAQNARCHARTGPFGTGA